MDTSNYIITYEVKESGIVPVAKLHLSERVATAENITSVVNRLKRSFEVDPKILEYFGGCTHFYKGIDVVGYGIPNTDEKLSFDTLRSKYSEYDIILALLFLEQATSIQRKMSHRVCVFISNQYEKNKFHLILTRNSIKLEKEIA